MESTDLQKKPSRTLFQWIVLVCAAVLSIAAVGLMAYWTYHKAKLWRAHYLTRAAESLIEQNKMTEAQTKLMAAFNLEPRDLEVVKTMAHYELSLQNIHALSFYHLMLQLPKVTKDDQREAAVGFLTFGDVKSASEVVSALIAQNPEAQDYALEGRVYWQAGKKADAVTVLRQATAMEPDNRAIKLLLAQVLAVTAGEDENSEAAELLRALADAQDKEALRALEIMARNPKLDLESRRWTLDKLRHHPLLDDEGRFASWELEKNIGDREPGAVINDAVDFFRSSEPSRKARAARWLYVQGEPERVLELAKPPASSDSQDLFLARMDALASLKRWNDVENEMTDTAPLPHSMIFLYRARAAQELGQPDISAMNWNRARAAATTENGMLSYLAEYAVKVGAIEEAKKTYAQMARDPEQAQQGYAGLLQVESHSGTNEEILQTLKQMMTDLPTLPEPKNDWAYLSLLMNMNVDEAFQSAQTLVKANPTFLAYRTTLALAYLKKNDPASALKVYDGLQIDWKNGFDKRKGDLHGCSTSKWYERGCYKIDAID